MLIGSSTAASRPAGPAWRVRRARRRPEQIVEVQRTGRALVAHADHHLQRGQTMAAQACFAVAELWREIAVISG